MRRRLLLLTLTASLTLGATSTASAQLGRMAFGLKAGSLGLGAEASVGLTRHLALRGGFNRFQLTRDLDLEGINYQVTPQLRSTAAMLDLHPFGGAFRLSGGVILNRNRGALAARMDPGQVLSIGDHRYSADQVQALTGGIGFKRSAPYLGWGFDNALGGAGRVSFNIDAGVMFQGRPRASLAGRTTLAGDERVGFEQDVVRETAQIQDRIDRLPRVINYYPVFAMGLKVRP